MLSISQILSSPYFYFAITGILSGFLSGLLSVGGGLILVPALIFIFAKFYTLEPHYAIQLVLGTTMSCMIFTSISSTLAQHKKSSIHWEYLKNNWFFIVLGTVSGVVLTDFIPTSSIKFVFALFCFFSGFKVLFKKPIEVKEISNFKNAKISTFFFSSLCGLIGVGGANMVVPFLMKKGVDLRKSLGTASAFQVPVSISGTLAYLITGLYISIPAVSQQNAIGNIFLPALIVITIFAIGFNKLGVSIAHKLPIDILKKCFGVFTLLVGLITLIHIFQK